LLYSRKTANHWFALFFEDPRSAGRNGTTEFRNCRNLWFLCNFENARKNGNHRSQFFRHYGTSFSDCKYISQIRVTKYFNKKKSIWNHFNDVVPLLLIYKTRWIFFFTRSKMVSGSFITVYPA
jgi:hypothetical protein